MKLYFRRQIVKETKGIINRQEETKFFLQSCLRLEADPDAVVASMIPVGKGGFRMTLSTLLRKFSARSGAKIRQTV